MNNVQHIRILPNLLDGIGGPSSFQRKLLSGLRSRGVEVSLSPKDGADELLFIINGTRRLGTLIKSRARGAAVVHRLGGPNWLPRRRYTDLRAWLLAEIRNLTMRAIRHGLADRIVYQSNFVRDWWNETYGLAPVPSAIVHNGVDLSVFSPDGPAYHSDAQVSVISVEGTLGTDPGDIAVTLVKLLRRNGVNAELLLFGRASKNCEKRLLAEPFIHYHGVVRNEDLPFYYRGAHFFLSTDIIAACPNSVLEALACGTPILGYRAGVLPELLTDASGILIDPTGDPWRCEPPGNEDTLLSAAMKLVKEQVAYRLGARALAVSRYGLDTMVERYLELFNEVWKLRKR